jgi:hypothetical protein
VAAGTLAALVVLAVALAFAVDEPLRRAIELQEVAVTGLDAEDGWEGARAADPPYRLYFSSLALDVRDFSTHGQRPTTVRAAARFMGSGATAATGIFRPADSPDFHVKLEIEDTDLTRLNDLLRAYAKVDVTQGLFTFYAEARVQNGAVQGYAKPLFRDLEVYHPGQDAAKRPVRQLYERVVGGVARLLENKTSRKEVATRTEFKGPLGGDVKAGTLEAVVGLVQNAFFKAILPGFEGQLGRRPSEGDRRP